MGSRSTVKKTAAKKSSPAMAAQVQPPAEEQVPPVAEAPPVVKTPAILASVPSGKKLQAKRFVLGVQVFNHWRVSFNCDTSIEDIEDPAFWTHVDKYAKPGDTFDGFTDDMLTYFKGLVLAVGHHQVFVKVTEEVVLEEKATVTVDSLFRSEHAGQHHKWRVMRIADDKMMRSGFESQKQAQTWITSQEQAIRR
jgi:hypothetical protein